MTVKCIIENAGHIFVSKPWLFMKNVKLLPDLGIDIKSCKEGKGAQVLGYLNLEKILETIKEMGYDDEVLGDKENSLEVIRACTISLNYNNYKDSLSSQYVKGAV